MFGYSEEQIAAFGLSFGVGAFMLYMLSSSASWHGNPRPANSAPLCCFWAWRLAWWASQPNT